MKKLSFEEILCTDSKLLRIKIFLRKGLSFERFRMCSSAEYKDEIWFLHIVLWSGEVEQWECVGIRGWLVIYFVSFSTAALISSIS